MCAEFTAIAVLCMFVGQDRWFAANTYRPRMCSMCIHAPTLRSTNVTQFGDQRSNALPLRAFSMFWVLRDDAALKESGISPMDLGKEAEALLGRFPNAVVNADEQRRLRAGLDRPLLALQKDERSRVVDVVVATLIAE